MTIRETKCIFLSQLSARVFEELEYIKKLSLLPSGYLTIPDKLPIHRTDRDYENPNP